MAKKIEKRKRVMVVKVKGTVPVNSPADVIRMAVAGKANLDKMEKFLELQERFEANQARKIFTSAFSNAQAQIATVLKTKVNPQTNSKYATLEDIIKSAQPIYTGEGFSIIFYEGETAVPECIRICADVLHRAGHKETYHYDIPLDGVGLKGNPNMTKIHAKASSTSYGRRYLMCMIWNIPTQDDDAQSAIAPIELITEKQRKQILDAVVEVGFDRSMFLDYMKVESIEKISKADFQRAWTAILIKRKKNADKK